MVALYGKVVVVVAVLVLLNDVVEVAIVVIIRCFLAPLNESLSLPPSVRPSVRLKHIL